MLAFAIPLLLLSKTANAVNSEISTILVVNPLEINLGTVFPQEILKLEWDVRLSNSFLSQQVIKSIVYKTSEGLISGLLDFRPNVVDTNRSVSENIEPQDTSEQGTLDVGINDISDRWVKTIFILPIEGSQDQSYLETGGPTNPQEGDYGMQIELVTDVELPITPAGVPAEEEAVVEEIPEKISRIFPKTGLELTSIAFMLIAFLLLILSWRLKTR